MCGHHEQTLRRVGLVVDCQTPQVLRYQFVSQQNLQDQLTERRAAVPTASGQSVILFSPQQAALMFTANNKREGCLDTLRPSYVGGAVGQQDYSVGVFSVNGQACVCVRVCVRV